MIELAQGLMAIMELLALPWEYPEVWLMAQVEELSFLGYFEELMIKLLCFQKIHHYQSQLLSAYNEYHLQLPLRQYPYNVL